MELQPVRPTVKTPAQNFTGDVYMTPIYNGQEPPRMTVALVRFPRGARTNWHSHAVDAGIQAPVIDAADEAAERFDRVTAINLRGVWACTKHELAQMRTQGSGAIVNSSSLGGQVRDDEVLADVGVFGRCGLDALAVVWPWRHR